MRKKQEKYYLLGTREGKGKGKLCFFRDVIRLEINNIYPKFLSLFSYMERTANEVWEQDSIYIRGFVLTKRQIFDDIRDTKYARLKDDVVVFDMDDLDICVKQMHSFYRKKFSLELMIYHPLSKWDFIYLCFKFAVMVGYDGIQSSSGDILIFNEKSFEVLNPDEESICCSNLRDSSQVLNPRKHITRKYFLVVGRGDNAESIGEEYIYKYYEYSYYLYKRGFFDKYPEAIVKEHTKREEKGEYILCIRRLYYNVIYLDEDDSDYDRFYSVYMKRYIPIKIKEPLVLFYWDNEVYQRQIINWYSRQDIDFDRFYLLTQKLVYIHYFCKEVGYDGYVFDSDERNIFLLNPECFLISPIVKRKIKYKSFYNKMINSKLYETSWAG